MALRMLLVIFIYPKQEAISRTIQIDYIMSQFIYKRVHLAESMDIFIVVCLLHHDYIAFCTLSEMYFMHTLFEEVDLSPSVSHRLYFLSPKVILFSYFSVLESRAQSTAAGGASGGDVESLPSYTVVSGLPTYDEALEQLRQVQQLRSDTKTVDDQAQHTQNNCTDNGSRQQPPLAKLAVTEFMQQYKSTTAI